MKTILLKPIILLSGVFLIYSCATNLKTSEEVQDNNYGQLNYKLLEHENIGRGVIAIPLDMGKKVYSGEGTFDSNKRKVYISWRLLASDSDNTTFNVYRQAENGEITKVNASPISQSTNIVDSELPTGDKFVYTVTPLIDGQEGETSKPYTVTLSSQPKPYKSIKLTSEHTIEKIAMADLDGDGEMDFVTKYPGGNVDPWYLYWKPSQDTYKLQAYKNNGDLLWTYDMGWAIEQGTWYSPYLVYDFNGDGKAEVVVKSGESDPRDMSGSYKNYVNNQGKGIVASGPEYLSVLDGMTGQTIAQADWISRDPFFEVNTEHAYNFASRNQISVAYLDGVHPHIVILRGTYNLMMARAYRLIDNELKLVWEWDNRNLRDDPNNYWGQGGHTTIAADVDGDGCDELILGSCVLDHNGSELWTTGLGHCDGMFVGDILPERPGLEIYYNMEARSPNGNGMCMVDAKTGKIIWGSNYPTDHIHGTGFCSDIDRTRPGRECYGIEIYNFEGKRKHFSVMYSSDGEIIDRDFISIRSVFWDSDNQRELLEDGHIFDYKGFDALELNKQDPTVEGRVIAIADIVGDWREEIITSVPGEIRIYSTTILTNNRHNCLIQDPIYRNYVAHASNGYYEQPMTTYDIPFLSSR